MPLHLIPCKPPHKRHSWRALDASLRACCVHCGLLESAVYADYQHKKYMGRRKG